MALNPGAVALSIRDLAPKEFVCHPLHAKERDWRESNCYVDLLVEVLHTLGLEVEACLSFTLATGFEGDQWTFFKPPAAELRSLYNVQIEELNLWRPLLDHMIEQVNRGAIPLLEADSFYLPDTRGTDYREQHNKTTIGITHVDPASERLCYFHNAGFFELSAEDFRGVLRISPEPLGLLPYCEIAKIQRARRRSSAESAALALELARGHYQARPSQNPFVEFAEHFPRHLELLSGSEPASYDGYAFSTLRQCGANFEYLAFFFYWLAGVELKGQVDAAFAELAPPFQQLSQLCKMLILKLARIRNGRKPADIEASILEMADVYHQAMVRVGVKLGI